MNGVLAINKPKDITSFDCIRQIRRTLHIDKIGHDILKNEGIISTRKPKSKGKAEKR